MLQDAGVDAAFHRADGIRGLRIKADAAAAAGGRASKQGGKKGGKHRHHKKGDKGGGKRHGAASRASGEGGKGGTGRGASAAGQHEGEGEGGHEGGDDDEEDDDGGSSDLSGEGDGGAHDFLGEADDDEGGGGEGGADGSAAAAEGADAAADGNAPAGPIPSVGSQSRKRRTSNASSAAGAGDSNGVLPTDHPSFHGGGGGSHDSQDGGGGQSGPEATGDVGDLFEEGAGSVGGGSWEHLKTLKLVFQRAGLDAGQQERFLAALHPMAFRYGERIVRQGDPGDALYIIPAGEVVVSRSVSAEEAATAPRGMLTDDGGEMIITHLYEGHFFGETSLVNEAPRNAHVKASR